MQLQIDFYVTTLSMLKVEQLILKMKQLPRTRMACSNKWEWLV